MWVDYKYILKIIILYFIELIQFSLCIANITSCIKLYFRTSPNKYTPYTCIYIWKSYCYLWWEFPVWEELKMRKRPRIWIQKQQYKGKAHLLNTHHIMENIFLVNVPANQWGMTFSSVRWIKCGLKVRK